jgi:tryptophan synthase alpha chain
MKTNALTEKLTKLTNNREKAFIPYIMAGDGGLERLKSDLLYFENAGATAIELGVPFSDPVADGPVVQRAGQRALSQGISLKKIIEKLQEIREEVNIPILFMTYLNSIMAYGIEAFATDCQKAGISGCIIPDLPIEEESIVANDLKQAGIVLIRLVTLTSPLERIEKIVKEAEGFIYAVTVKGITGVRAGFGEDVGAYLERVRKISPIPVFAGFGISTPEHVRQASLYCDGVIVGSKIIECIENNQLNEIEDLISASKQVVR